MAVPGTMIRTRGRVNLTLEEINVNRENREIHRQVTVNTPLQERTTIWSAVFTYMAPYFVHLYRDSLQGPYAPALNPYQIRRWYHYPVEPRMIVVRRLNAPPNEPFEVVANSGTVLFSHWMGQMFEDFPTCLDLYVFFMQNDIVFGYVTGQYRYNLYLHRFGVGAAWVGEP